ncbi:zinc finger BED domain-containing protein 4-like [Oryzias latipes]|uniref:zinc finger BED domain-containing protein 4-like n=1 Tax=Oryzias latipes TaxID=8090 RepID=UPI000CE18010|nr:zinc finger BED domain-containing protein 4-like [Oryzias latipes]
MSWVCRMEFCLIMDRPRKFSPVWNNFDLVTPNKVKCRLCSTELSYINKSTSSMLRHYRARHGNEELADTRDSTPVPNKQAVDEAVVNMIIKDCQPLSFVENEGFRELLKLILPSYALPSRKTIKDLVSQRYEEEKEKTKKDLQSAVAVTLTADMWTSMNMEAYLAVTGHYVDKESQELYSSVLAVQHFPQKHTAENIATVKRSLMEEWGIAGKVRCLVTDAAANMAACARMLQIRHTICIAHSLNLIVRKSCDQIPAITEIRNKTRHIVTYFRSSVTAKEKLTQIQQQLGTQGHKLINEVPTQWNSTYQMFERMTEQKEAVWVSLASLKPDITPLTPEECQIIEEMLRVLAPFDQATRELSEEKRVSGSKVIPMMRMLHIELQRQATTVTKTAAQQLAENLRKRLTDAICGMESLSVMTLATLLDPRFKKNGFVSQQKASEAVKRLQSECAEEMRSQEPDAREEEPSSSHGSEPSSGHNLWKT